MKISKHELIPYLKMLQRSGVSDLPADVSEMALKLNSMVTAGEPVADAQTTKTGKVRGHVERQGFSEKNPSTASSHVAETVSRTTMGIDLADAYPPREPEETRISQLAVLQQQVEGCSRCDQLVACRTKTVFGVGNPEARICFFGEAPGADEDRIGEPFVGAAGQLLDRIIAACKLSRDEVYIMNTVKCRPPGNRNPTESETGNCWQFAERQFEIIQPEIIVCLGSVAASTLLKTKNSISRMRQKFHNYRSSLVAVTYHPAYLLRTPSAKKHVWDDMKMVLDKLGIQL